MALTSDRKTARKSRTRKRATIEACAAHLKDLKAAHGKPPPDVPLVSRAIPQRLEPVPTASWCSSPGQMCAELAK